MYINENENVYKCFAANMYLFKVNNRNPKKRCEICSELTLNIFHTFF